MNSKRARICMIVLFGIGLAAVVIEAAGMKAFSPSLKKLLLIPIVMFLLGGVIMSFVWNRLLKKEMEAAKRTVYKNPEYDEKEFLQWLVNFEPFVRMGARLKETSEKTFSKFGGLPLVPQGFNFPFYDNRPIPFLLQIDFAEVNPDGKLDGFPTAGLLYLFVDSDEVNDPTFEDGEEEYAQGRTFQVMFFEPSENLKTPDKPSDLEYTYKEFNVGAETVETYPDTDDCKEAFDIYCNRPAGGLDDGYDELQGENMDEFMLGGWATYIQGSSFARDSEFDDDNKLNADEWVLLLQVASDVSDDKFMWGDSGMLYFYIKKADLLARKFDNIKMDMQCF